MLRWSSSLTHTRTHAHTHRVALGSPASHRNNYVSTTRTTTTQGKHSVVLSLTQSLFTLICPFALAQFSFHFISLVFPFSAHAACLRFQFLHISISISIAISIFVFAFPFYFCRFSISIALSILCLQMEKTNKQTPVPLVRHLSRNSSVPMQSSWCRVRRKCRRLPPKGKP